MQIYFITDQTTKSIDIIIKTCTYACFIPDFVLYILYNQSSDLFES